MINDDIDEITQRGEERTQELNSNYEGLNLDDLDNFKSDANGRAKTSDLGQAFPSLLVLPVPVCLLQPFFFSGKP
jgi:hypothetical protein